MADDSPKDPPGSESAAQGQPAPDASPSQPVQEVPDRAELLARARAFLSSPHVRLQDSDAKRTFLAEKGLTPSEIDQLVQELPPSVPPRTYPAPLPSNLPNLLIGVARIFTWFTGTSAIVLYIYYRYLLPRLAQSYQARLALRRSQSTLIARLTESASALKATQTQSYSDLPRIVPVYEDSQYAQCHTIDDLLSHVASSREETTRPGADIPSVTILRCALEELGRTKMDGTSTEELFRHLESKLLGLNGKDGEIRQSDLWEQLSACPLFVSSPPKSTASSPLSPDQPSRLLWKYVPPPLPTTSPFLASLENLRGAVSRGEDVEPASSSGPLSTLTVSARQRTLQVLSDFTGYITTQTYPLAGLPLIRASGGNPVEDELRREIRALKGLVLNRRSFLPTSAGTSEITNGLSGPS